MRKVTKTETLTWTYRAFKITDRWRESNKKKPICLEIDWERKTKSGETQYITDTTYHKTIGEALDKLYQENGTYES